MNQFSKNSNHLNLMNILESGSRVISTGIRLVEAKTEVELYAQMYRFRSLILLSSAAFFGMSALVAASIILLGDLLEHQYAFSAAIIGAGLICLSALLTLINKKRSKK